MAGPNGVQPASGVDIPPPSLEVPTFTPTTGAVGGAGSDVKLPPPSVTQDPVDTKFPPAPTSVDPPAAGSGPLVPVPPLPGAGGPAPIGPLGPSTPVPPIPPVGGPAIPIPGGDNPVAPPATNVRPAAPASASLPAKITQMVTLEAVCPETVVYGGEFKYDLIVKNAGSVPVSGVRIEDELPAGAKYVGSDPPAELNADRISWAIGTLDAGAEKRITVRLRPSDEGEIRSRATVVYSAAVDAKTRVTRPRLAIAVMGAEVCKAGEETVFQIKVVNNGTGPAQRMILQAKLSEGLFHKQGAVIEAELSNLAAGESKTIPLSVTASKAGLQSCQITVAAQGSQDATGKSSVNVVEPRLEIAQTGPAKCFVRAEPTYEITLSNPGTAATDPITLYSILPEGFEYLQATDGAAFNAASRAVVWKLPGLAPGATKALSLKVRSAVAGDGVLRTVAQASAEQPGGAVVGAGGVPAARPLGRVLEAKTETPVSAEGVAAVRFEVIDLEDPVAVGKEAIYEIRVMNQGTGACTNVQLVAAMAEGTAHTSSSGPTTVKAQGQHLVFEPIPTLGVKGEAVYRVKVRGAASGDQRFRVQLTCDQIRTPIVKEESTRFVKE
jgi:uncharacterized repeat protein (TIGR01451 family)